MYKDRSTFNLVPFPQPWISNFHHSIHSYQMQIKIADFEGNISHVHSLIGTHMDIHNESHPIRNRRPRSRRAKSLLSLNALCEPPPPAQFVSFAITPPAPLVPNWSLGSSAHSRPKSPKLGFGREASVVVALTVSAVGAPFVPPLCFRPSCQPHAPTPYVSRALTPPTPSRASKFVADTSNSILHAFECHAHNLSFNHPYMDN